jgi:hypothetical protein
VNRFVDFGACFRQNNLEMNPQIGLHNNYSGYYAAVFNKSISITVKKAKFFIFCFSADGLEALMERYNTLC